MRSLCVTDALSLRMRHQGLAGAVENGVAGAARAAAGLQAQDLLACRLAVRARTRGLGEGDVVRACATPPEVVRTWLMRGTLHLVPAKDVRWLVALLGPDIVRRQRRRRLGLGLDDDLCGRALAAMPDVLAEGPLSRAALVAGLAEYGVAVNPSGQAPAHLVLLAAASGLICRGPEVGAEATYVLLDHWFPPEPGRAPTGDEAAVELARRYFAAFSPATTDDFAAWSGLPAGRAHQAVAGLGDELTVVTIEGQPAWLTPRQPGKPAEAGHATWRLLPAFDTYVVGYRRTRGLGLDDRFASRINAGGGWVHPSVVLDGRIVGTWRLHRRAGGAVVAVERFEPEAGDGSATAAGLHAEAADVGRFLGLEATLRVR